MFFYSVLLCLCHFAGPIQGGSLSNAYQKGSIMSGITLSSAVRQNLLSLQNTASLASITQNRLATGKKVNSAPDNPVNFFTASGLDSRSNDISNLLDRIGNRVQALKAADTAI